MITIFHWPTLGVVLGVRGFVLGVQGFLDFFVGLFISAKTFMSDMFFQVIEYYPNFRIHIYLKIRYLKIR